MKSHVVSKHAFRTCLLAGAALFKSLDAATLARLATVTTRRSLKRGETLFHKGDPVTGMYIVVHGEIKLIATTPVRGSRLSGIVGPGRSFCEPVMFLERPTPVEAQAATDALLLHVPKEAVFEDRTQPEVRQAHDRRPEPTH